MEKKPPSALPANDESERAFADRMLRNRMEQIKHKLLVIDSHAEDQPLTDQPERLVAQ